MTTGTTYGSGSGGSASYNSGQIICVNRAGSTPPVAADVTTGATITYNVAGTWVFETAFPVYHYGISFIYTGTNFININSGQLKTISFDACQLYLNTATTTVRIETNNPSTLILNNSTLRFGNASQAIASSSYPFQIEWQNTASALAGATFPSILFQPIGGILLVTCRGVDLSAVTGKLIENASSASGSKYLFDSCKIASSVTRYSTTGVANTRDEVELVNCYDGTHFISERYQQSGAVTTEFTITLSGGAADNAGAYSHKMVSNTNVDKFVEPLRGFWMDCNYTITGSSKTATVEIISSASLNNDEISLVLEYEGTAGSSVASFGSSFIATPLTAAAAVTTSTAIWNNSPATPVKQKLQVTFTPQVAGRVRGQVRLGKASATVYVNPQITIT